MVFQICTKCVKCKSCGATTPGSGSAATWMYDFQLCYECGQLMDKGNPLLPFLYDCIELDTVKTSACIAKKGNFMRSVHLNSTHHYLCYA